MIFFTGPGQSLPHSVTASGRPVAMSKATGRHGGCQTRGSETGAGTCDANCSLTFRAPFFTLSPLWRPNNAVP